MVLEQEEQQQFSHPFITVLKCPASASQVFTYVFGLKNAAVRNRSQLGSYFCQWNISLKKLKWKWSIGIIIGIRKAEMFIKSMNRDRIRMIIACVHCMRGIPCLWVHCQVWIYPAQVLVHPMDLWCLVCSIQIMSIVDLLFLTKRRATIIIDRRVLIEVEDWVELLYLNIISLVFL